MRKGIDVRHSTSNEEYEDTRVENGGQCLDTRFSPPNQQNT